MSLQSWVRDNYNDLELLKLSHDLYTPGVILFPKKKEILSDCWSVLGETGQETHWAPRQGPATLATSTFEHETGSKLDGKLLGLLTLGVSSARKITASFEVTGVQVRRFATLPRLQLEQKLRGLKKPGSETWKQIDGKTVVEECYYVERARVAFREEGQVLAKVDVEQVVKPSVSAGGELRWLDNETLEVVGQGSVPFGFRGFRL